MKVYLISRYSRFLEMQRYRAELTVLGHRVTSRWINGEHRLKDNDETEAQRFAIEDIEDLLAADCIISFTEAPRSEHSRGGRHVEFGIAIMCGKRLMVVGYRENVFYYLPQVEFFRRWEDLLRKLT